MKITHEVLSVENQGDYLRVKLQGQSAGAAEWRPMLTAYIDIPDSVKNRQAYHVGRKVTLTLSVG